MPVKRMPNRPDTDTLDPMMIVDVAYLAVMGIIGLTVTARRLDKLLLK